jgi:hypothetical protein
MKKITCNIKPAIMVVYMLIFMGGLSNISSSMGWEPGKLKGSGFVKKPVLKISAKKPTIKVVSPMQAINSKFF